MFFLFLLLLLIFSLQKNSYCGCCFLYTGLGLFGTKIVYNSVRMLGQVLKKYETFKKSNQKSLQSQKQTIEQHLQAKTIQALKIQNHKVSKIHSNQQQIQNRLRRNSQLQGQLKIHLGGWFLLYDELNKTLKEAGDVVNYASYVQEQIRQINCQLQRRMEEKLAQTQVKCQEVKKQPEIYLAPIETGELKDQAPNNQTVSD